MYRTLCTNCHKHWVPNPDILCSECQYQSLLAYELSLDPDEQDWEFAHCDECGSSLGSDGRCHNTSCGAPPDVGIDWL